MAAVTVSFPFTVGAGSHAFGPVTPPLGTTHVKAALDRTGLSLLTQPISWSIQVSLDAGQTWLDWGGASAAPGNLLDDNLQLITESSFEIDLPAPAGANTRLQGVLVSGELMTTTVKITAS
jgi:hypothetical protein